MQTYQAPAPPARSSRVVVVLLVLILAVLVVDTAVTIGLLLAIRGDLGDWGRLIDAFYGYVPPNK